MEKVEPLRPLLVGLQSGVTAIETKICHDQATHLEYKPKVLKAVFWREIFIPIFAATLFMIAEEVEATQLSTSGWVDKQNEVCVHTGILFSLKKEGNGVTDCNVDEPWGRYAKWNKPVGNTWWFRLYEVSKVVIFVDK